MKYLRYTYWREQSCDLEFSNTLRLCVSQWDWIQYLVKTRTTDCQSNTSNRIVYRTDLVCLKCVFPVQQLPGHKAHFLCCHLRQRYTRNQMFVALDIILHCPRTTIDGGAAFIKTERVKYFYPTVVTESLTQHLMGVLDLPLLQEWFCAVPWCTHVFFFSTMSRDASRSSRSRYSSRHVDRDAEVNDSSISVRKKSNDDLCQNFFWSPWFSSHLSKSSVVVFFPNSSCTTQVCTFVSSSFRPTGTDQIPKHVAGNPRSLITCPVIFPLTLSLFRERHINISILFILWAVRSKILCRPFSCETLRNHDRLNLDESC